VKTDSHFVSLVIPTIGRKTLAFTKAAVRSQTRPPDELIVIIDKFRRGQGWVRNQGFQQAKGDLIAFTDDDCIPGNDWLDRMIAAIDKYDAAMVSSDYLETDTLLNEIRIRRKFPTTVQVNPGGFVGTGGNVIFRRSCLEDCLDKDGFIFNPIFRAYGSEDIDLVFRLRNLKYKLVFIDNKIKHLKKTTPLKYIRQHFNRGIGIGILYRIHKKSVGTETPDKSLLWDVRQKRFPALKWLLMVWRKVLGPFDVRSFSSIKHFFVFWLGEKVQAFGFLYALVFKCRNM